MALLNGINRYPLMQAPQMHFIQPPIPQAPSVNPELAKSQSYGGGGAGAVPGTAAPAAGGAPADGQQPQQQGGGIIGSISRMLGGSGGIDPAQIMQLLASLG